MNDINQHSPTPWRIFIDDDGAVNVATNAPEYTGDQICFVSSDYQDDEMTNVANAAHIVQCVNAHDGLVRALYNLVDLCKSLSRGPALAEGRAALRAAGIEVAP